MVTPISTHQILLKDLGGIISKPLIFDIEIILPNEDIKDFIVGIIDTGADLTCINDQYCNMNGKGEIPLRSLGNTFLELNFRVRCLFKDEILKMEIRTFNLSSKSFSGQFRNPMDNDIDNMDPILLLGRDFLKRCAMEYKGIQNLVKITGYTI